MIDSWFQQNQGNDMFMANVNYTSVSFFDTEI